MCCLTPAEADASDFDLTPLLVPAGIAYGAPIVLFTSVDLYYAGKGSWAPPAWAIPELITGVSFAATGTAIAVNSSDPGVAAAILYTPAALMVTHGIFSLAKYEPPEAMPVVSPVRGGAVFLVSGDF